MENSVPSHQVLVAIADPQSREVLQRAFTIEAPDVSLEFVSDGASVVDYLQCAPLCPAECPKPAMLLIDLQVPVMDAFQVLQWLGTVPELAPPHIIVVAYSHRPEDPDRAWALGATSFLVTPSDFEQLCEVARGLAAVLREEPQSAEPVCAGAVDA